MDQEVLQEQTEVTEAPAETAAENRETAEEVPAGALSSELQERMEKEAESVEEETHIFRDANGDFNWGLLAVILAAAMLLVAVFWIFTKIVKLFGSALLIVLAVLVIIYTIFNIRE